MQYSLVNDRVQLQRFIFVGQPSLPDQTRGDQFVDLLRGLWRQRALEDCARIVLGL